MNSLKQILTPGSIVNNNNNNDTVSSTGIFYKLNLNIVEI